MFYHIKKLMKIKSIYQFDAEKAFGKVQHPFMIKFLSQLRIKNFPNLIMNIYKMPTAKYINIYIMVKMEFFPSKIGNNARMFLFLFNSVLEVLASAT